MEEKETNLQRKKIIILLLCFAVIIASIGLYYYNAIHRLRIRLVDVGLGTVGVTSAEIKLKIEVQNPNALPVYIPSLDFDVYVNDQHLANGYLGAFTVGGGGRHQKWVSLTFSYIDVATTLVNLIINHETVTVRVDGSANFFLVSIPFTTTLLNVEFT